MHFFLNAGCVWGRVADKLVDSGAFTSVVFATTGIGGTSIEELSGETVNGYSYLKKTMAQMQQIFGRVDAILFDQGESDAFTGRARDGSYQFFFEKLLHRLDSDFEIVPPIHVAVATKCILGDVPDPELQTVQRKIADELAFPGPNTDLIPLSDRYDGCHFSSKGLDKVADAWVDVLGLRQTVQPTTVNLTLAPTERPTVRPPTLVPTERPTVRPTTLVPTERPTVNHTPTKRPSTKADHFPRFQVRRAGKKRREKKTKAAMVGVGLGAVATVAFVGIMVVSAKKFYPFSDKDNGNASNALKCALPRNFMLNPMHATRVAKTPPRCTAVGR